MSDEPISHTTHRHSTSSRQPGVNTGGSHRILILQFQICNDCGGTCSGDVRQGQHSPRMRRDPECGHYRLVNCVLRNVGDCNECEKERE